MPFTPFHLGPAIGLGLPLRRYSHIPTFIVASVILDIEPFLVLHYNLNYPLHGYLHTFILAFSIGLLLGYVTFFLENKLKPVFKVFLLETDKDLRLRSFLLTGASGTTLHVLLDSPLYTDIYPFYPLSANPLYDPSLSLGIYTFCVLTGIIGLVYYAGLLVLSAYRKLST